MVKEGIMKLHWDIPIKKKTKIYISIIAVTVSITFGLNYLKYRISLSQMKKNSGYFVEKNLSSFPLSNISKIYLKEKGEAKYAIFHNYYLSPLVKKIELSALKNLNHFSAVSIYFREIVEADLRYLNSNPSIELAYVNGIIHSSNILNISNKSLKYLDIRFSTIKNIHFAKNLKLKYLDLNYSEINGIYGIENLNKLKTLKLAGHYITNLTPLEGCIELEELNILGCAVKDFSPLRKLKKLKKLSVSLYDDLEFLKEMKSLKELNFKITSPIISLKDAIKEYKKVFSITDKLEKMPLHGLL